MGNSLHKVGMYAFKHPVWVVFGWIVVLAILGWAAATYIKPTSSAISIPGTEAQKALDRMGELFPGAGKGSGRIVFAAPSGKTISDYNDAISITTTGFSKIDGVSQVIDPNKNPTAISSDKKIAYTQLQLTSGSGSIKAETITDIQKVVDEARKSGLEVEMGGDIISKVPGDILGPSEIGGLILTLVVLIMTLGSLVAAGMPLLTALLGVGITMAGLFSLSQVFTISSTTPVLAVMLGLAVGIDYSLFIINRYRMYVAEGISFEKAAARAIGTAGNAVVFAAATVIIALAALSVVQIPFMTTMGLAAAAAIAVAALVAITLIPALLRFGGKFVFSKRMRAKVLAAQKKGPRENHHADRKTFWYRWGAAVTKRPLIVLITGVILIGVIALPARSLWLGLPTDQFAATSSSERKAYDLLAKGFGPGFNGPLIVLVEDLPTVSDSQKETFKQQAVAMTEQKIAEATQQTKDAFAKAIAQAQSPEAVAILQQQQAAAEAAVQAQEQKALAQVNASVGGYSNLIEVQKVADTIASKVHVSSATAALVSEDGHSGLIQIVPKTAPSDKATIDLINQIRNPSDREKLTGSKSIDLSVTGSTALQLDINTKLANALPVYLFVVIGLSFIILVIAFRSILVPIKATVGFLLSVLAMFGALVAVFQWGWFGIADAPGPIISFTPIITIGIMFGLAMDYEFFLVTSMHEAYHETKDAQRSVLRGFAHASKVVVAAAIIMVSIFAGFIGDHDVTIQAIGFALAFGIFIDAFVVRLTLVPAAMALLDKAAWWLPKWLDRILPHISIEGEDEK